MKIVYYNEEMPETVTKSCFLAGPSRRPGQEDLESWREDAIKILEDIGFENGTVFIPEFRNEEDKKSFSYSKAIEWEEKFLNIADCIVFWVPRTKELKALTTNIEYGHWSSSGKIVFGFPEGAEKMDYMAYYANKYNVPISNSLTKTLNNALDMLGEGAERSGGERYVPLMIWNLPSFQNWYKAQTGASNKLESAKLLYSFRPGFKKITFLWILKVSIYIASEDRVKDNQFVLSRTDISSVLLWKKNLPLENSEIVFIREFRSPASTENGFITELPGGSSNSASPKETASEEIQEETGCYIEPDRLISHESRQLMGTLSAHKSHFYSVDLTDDEIKWFKSQKNVVYGKEEDSERTFIEVYSIKDLLNKKIEVDWSTLGMVLFCYYKAWNNINEED